MVGNNFDRLLGGYQTLRPRLTKYCRGRVPGIPGGVDAYDRLTPKFARRVTLPT